MSVDRKELVRLNIIHEFDAALAVASVRSCYGQIVGRFYARILRQVKGPRILDAGCGFGQFSRLCLDRGLSVHSIDIDEKSLAIARTEYGVRCFNESVYQTTLPDQSIDTIVSNDAICHFDLDRFLREAHRLGAKRIIVHDSNILNPLLRMYRQSTGHGEYRSYTPFEVVEEFRLPGFHCVKLDFVNYVSLPITGGFQRRPVPLISRFPSAVYVADRAIETVGSLFPIRYKLAFRFIAVFDNGDAMVRSGAPRSTRDGD